MHISKIPSDIIEAILWNASNPNLRRMSLWKKTLPLLAVCHNWRKLALPIVYSYVQANNMPNNQYDGNFHLAIESLASGYARYVTIVIQKMPRPNCFFQQVVLKMMCSAQGWSKVASLCLGLGEFNTDDTSSQAEISQLASGIKTLFPNINSLAFIGCGVSNNRLLCGSIVDMYVSQLHELRSNVPLYFTISEFSDNLKYLDMEFLKGIPPYIPKVCVHSLKCLKLASLSKDYDWNSFKQSGKDTDVQFSQLRKLSIDYTRDNQQLTSYLPRARNVKCKFSFPMLKALHLENAPDNCALLSNATFPKKMTSVYYAGSVSSLYHLANSGIDYADSMEIYLKDLTFDSTQLVLNTNALFSAIKVTNSSKLFMPWLDVSIDLNSICWPNLTDLMFMNSISTTTLLQVLKILPGLESLHVGKVIVGSNVEDYELPKVSSKGILVPINARLLSYNSFWRVASPDLAGLEVEFIKYLMLRLPSLQIFKSSKIPAQPLQEFINNYQESYPHLANLELEIQLPK